jgi:hypothetical protein
LAFIKPLPTPRALDAGDSGEIPGSFLRLSLFPLGRLTAVRPSASNANRWALREEITMKRLNKILFLLILVISSFPLASCGDVPVTDNDRVEIYRAVIREMIFVDNSFGKPVSINHLYILKNTDDGIGGEEIPNLPSEVFSDEIMKELETKLSDVAQQIIWVDSFHKVPKSKEGAAVEDGAIITLGNVRRKSNSEVYVSIGIYFANVAGSSTTYILEKENDIWIIRERIGGEVAREIKIKEIAMESSFHPAPNKACT